MLDFRLFSLQSIFGTSRPIRDFQEQTPINISNENRNGRQSGDDSGLGTSLMLSFNATGDSNRVSRESRVIEADQLPSDVNAKPSFHCRYCSKAYSRKSSCR
ncbi:unnamed protein product [Rodentolepis nana]|uniref:C2H2-type domain-containing protein n=1 Tax=Rodentolepis nana TaxID=102285 RepID=A0A0R3TDK3_RODNA|nr:unnamed protein product [Rodentolepis nana]